MLALTPTDWETVCPCVFENPRLANRVLLYNAEVTTLTTSAGLSYIRRDAYPLLSVNASAAHWLQVGSSAEVPRFDMTPFTVTTKPQLVRMQGEPLGRLGEK